jgi:hypothetical protein
VVYVAFWMISRAQRIRQIRFKVVGDGFDQPHATVVSQHKIESLKQESTEHYAPHYLVEPDDNIFGTDMRTVPPVIGG